MAIMVESWNEWDPLEVVLLGSSIGAQVPKADRSLMAINYADKLNSTFVVPEGPYPSLVIEETEADLELLASTLRHAGVQVHRPDLKGVIREFSTGNWQGQSYYQYCPRDSVTIIGQQIIEAPMPLRSRYFETMTYKNLFLQAVKSGAKWVQAPKPALLDDAYRLDGIDRDVLTLNELEPCFDAANILRCGRDIFYLVSNSGNKLGAKWLQSYLGEDFRVHLLEGIYSYMHIDSTISFLRPGLVLLNPARINDENLPDILRKWDKIWCAPPVDIGYYHPYCHASEWIGMNLLMIHPKLAIVEERQVELIAQLEAKGIECLPLPTRHARTLGGGFHCVTLDLKRRGQLEDYFT